MEVGGLLRARASLFKVRGTGQEVVLRGTQPRGAASQVFFSQAKALVKARSKQPGSLGAGVSGTPSRPPHPKVQVEPAAAGGAGDGVHGLQQQAGEMEVREWVACPGLSAPRPRVRACSSGVPPAHTHTGPLPLPHFLPQTTPSGLGSAGPASASVALSSSFPPQDLGQCRSFHLKCCFSHSSPGEFSLILSKSQVEAGGPFLRGPLEL